MAPERVSKFVGLLEKIQSRALVTERENVPKGTYNLGFTRERSEFQIVSGARNVLVCKRHAFLLIFFLPPVCELFYRKHCSSRRLYERFPVGNYVLLVRSTGYLFFYKPFSLLDSRETPLEKREFLNSDDFRYFKIDFLVLVLQMKCSLNLYLTQSFPDVVRFSKLSCIFRVIYLYIYMYFVLEF